MTRLAVLEPDGALDHLAIQHTLLIGLVEDGPDVLDGVERVLLLRPLSDEPEHEARGRCQDNHGGARGSAQPVDRSGNEERKRLGMTQGQRLRYELPDH